MRGVCRPHIEALHEGLKHPLFAGTQGVCLGAAAPMYDVLFRSQADSPSSGWTWWLCSAARCTAPPCAENTSRRQHRLTEEEEEEEEGNTDAF